MDFMKIMRKLDGKSDKFIKEPYNTVETMESNIENGICFLKSQCIDIKKKCTKMYNESQIYNKLEKVMTYMLSNPLLLVSFIFIAALLIVPVLLFTTFAIINVAMAFSGFIIIEVMLLLIGMTVLCCIIFFILTTVVLAGVTLILSFYVMYFSFSLVTKKFYSKSMFGSKHN